MGSVRRPMTTLAGRAFLRQLNEVEAGAILHIQPTLSSQPTQAYILLEAVTPLSGPSGGYSSASIAMIDATTNEPKAPQMLFPDDFVSPRPNFLTCAGITLVQGPGRPEAAARFLSRVEKLNGDFSAAVSALTIGGENPIVAYIDAMVAITENVSRESYVFACTAAQTALRVTNTLLSVTQVYAAFFHPASGDAGGSEFVSKIVQLAAYFTDAISVLTAAINAGAGRSESDLVTRIGSYLNALLSQASNSNSQFQQAYEQFGVVINSEPQNTTQLVDDLTAASRSYINAMQAVGGLLTCLESGKIALDAANSVGTLIAAIPDFAGQNPLFTTALDGKWPVEEAPFQQLQDLIGELSFSMYPILTALNLPLMLSMSEYSFVDVGTGNFDRIINVAGDENVVLTIGTPIGDGNSMTIEAFLESVRFAYKVAILEEIQSMYTAATAPSGGD